ncbi:GNAT family N-acetyltransferase [Cohnella silvisoli]|uniref:GNAT family N-acetyltransferase n=1 Tax=Cohnella silvisoli TaxID=2873699 RepID=A0ABV1KY68_9BACL|nr:GNAT family N-acetyltransferase [Cohnella silvisoli]MCD9023854.1 GNAT family N-acetyltransferase [Cohnella silvisoli]
MTPQSHEIRLDRLHLCTFEQALGLRNRGFEGYYTNMTVTMEQLLTLFSDYGIRPELSVVARFGEQPVGFVFLAFKTVNGVKLAWNGGTGVFPEYRGHGIAKAMMEEVRRILETEAADRAFLEVVTKNTHAVSAYEKGGFRIVDQITGMSLSEPLVQLFSGMAVPAGVRLNYGNCSDAAAIPFYRHEAAWDCQWHNIREGESLILTDSRNEVIAYALFQRKRSADGAISSVNLYQCEADPLRADKSVLFGILLHQLFGESDGAYAKQAVNLSMSHPELIALLKEAGFTTNYEQYLMMWERK